MQEIIDKILQPNKTLEDIFPAKIDLKELKQEVRAFIQEAAQNVSCSKHPSLINVCGLPASGKTYLCEQIKQKNKNLLYVSFDNIMENLPSYLSEHAKDKIKAFERWEIPARFVGYQILKTAVKRKVPLLFEHSNATPYHLDLYQKIKQYGYEIEICYIDAELELVLPRLKKRERYFCEQRTKERSLALKTLMPQYEKIATKFKKTSPWREK